MSKADDDIGHRVVIELEEVVGHTTGDDRLAATRCWVKLRTAYIHTNSINTRWVIEPSR